MRPGIHHGAVLEGSCTTRETDAVLAHGAVFNVPAMARAAQPRGQHRLRRLLSVGDVFRRARESEASGIQALEWRHAFRTFVIEKVPPHHVVAVLLRDRRNRIEPLEVFAAHLAPMLVHELGERADLVRCRRRWNDRWFWWEAAHTACLSDRKQKGDDEVALFHDA